MIKIKTKQEGMDYVLFASEEDVNAILAVLEHANETMSDLSDKEAQKIKVLISELHEIDNYEELSDAELYEMLDELHQHDEF